MRLIQVLIDVVNNRVYSLLINFVGGWLNWVIVLVVEFQMAPSATCASSVIFALGGPRTLPAASTSEPDYRP